MRSTAQMKQAAKKPVDKKNWSRWPLRITWRVGGLFMILIICRKDDRATGFGTATNSKGSQFLFKLWDHPLYRRFRVYGLLTTGEAPQHFWKAVPGSHARHLDREYHKQLKQALRPPHQQLFRPLQREKREREDQGVIIWIILMSAIILMRLPKFLRWSIKQLIAVEARITHWFSFFLLSQNPLIKRKIFGTTFHQEICRFYGKKYSYKIRMEY